MYQRPQRIPNINRSSKNVEETNPSIRKKCCWCKKKSGPKTTKEKTPKILERWQETKEKTCLKKSGLNSTTTKTIKILER